MLGIIAISDDAETALRVAKTISFDLGINYPLQLENRIRLPDEEILSIISKPLKIEDIIPVLHDLNPKNETLVVAYFRGESSYAILLTPSGWGVSVITPKQFWNINWLNALTQLRIRAQLSPKSQKRK